MPRAAAARSENQTHTCLILDAARPVALSRLLKNKFFSNLLVFRFESRGRLRIPVLRDPGARKGYGKAGTHGCTICALSCMGEIALATLGGCANVCTHRR